MRWFPKYFYVTEDCRIQLARKLRNDAAAGDERRGPLRRGQQRSLHKGTVP
jgi:hypothetical protein